MTSKHSIITAESHIVKDIEWPSVTSEDPNERKLARQQRIERRVAALKLQAIREKGEDVEKEKEPVEIQMEKSAGILETFLRESQEYLENVRVANEVREVDRRESEGIGREKVMAQLEAEAAEAQNQFSKITGKWAGIHDYKDPLHIHDDILLQKIKCDELIQQKDEIIDMLKKEVRLAEGKFTRDQMKQNQDIRILGQRIEKQINFMKKAYNTEFMLIDQVISEEKQKFIDKSNDKWEDLYRKRNQEEIALCEYRFQKQDEMAHNIQSLTVCHEEQFRKTKIQLELDIQNAQNEFEKIKALALSNSERLDYNYQVLKRRENENLIIKSQQKRRISKLQDAISELKTTLSSYRENTSKQIKKTKSDIEKLRKNIIDIDVKADQFAITNEKKFNDVWQLNAKDCYALLEKIIQIDRLLHEQQMGVGWVRPVYQKMDMMTMPSYQRASNIVKRKSSLSLKPMKSSDRLISSSIGTKLQPSDPNANILNPAYRKMLKYILKAIGNKSGFLTEKCIKLLINSYEDDQQSLVTLNNVFISLEIKKSEDIDLLVDFFLPYCYCQLCSDHISSHGSFISSAMMSRHLSQVSYLSKTSFLKSDYLPSVNELEHAWDAIQQSDAFIDDIVLEVVAADSLVDDQEFLKIQLPDAQSEDDEPIFHLRERTPSRRRTQKLDIEKLSCKYNHPLVISTVYVLSALKDFVISYHQQIQGSPTVGERLSRKRYTLSRLLDDKDIESYWTNLRMIYDESNILIWDSLREGLMRYLEILKDRKTISEEVLKLRKRNKDLKRLLADYMDHGVTMKAPYPIESLVAVEKINEEEMDIQMDTENVTPVSSICLKADTFGNSNDQQEEVDVFEDTSSTPSLSSEDNKVHLKRGTNFEKRTFIPIPLEVNKMKLDINRINELDRFRNITSGRNFFSHFLRPQAEKLRKTFLKDIDVVAGPSDLPAKKRKKTKPSFSSETDDGISSLDDMKSVTNCIIENTLNKINVDVVIDKNRDDFIGFSNAPVYGPVLQENMSEGFQVFQEYMDFDNGSVIDVRNKGGNSFGPKKDLMLENDIYSYNINITPSSYPLQQTINPDPTNDQDEMNIPTGNHDNAPNPSPSNNTQDSENSSDNENAETTESMAQASREAIVDPNSVLDLLDDFGLQQREDLNGIIGLGNFVVVGIHPVPDDFDTNNGFPNWLLQILGNQVAVEDAIPITELDEPHFYCQGDGLVEVDDEEEDDESTNTTNNTADFAEVDQGISSHDASSLPEDSQGIITDTQDRSEEESADRNRPAATTQLQNEVLDSVSNLSDGESGNGKNL